MSSEPVAVNLIMETGFKLRLAPGIYNVGATVTLGDGPVDSVRAMCVKYALLSLDEKWRAWGTNQHVCFRFSRLCILTD